MSDEIQVGDLSLAPGVLETIVTLAAREVEGVAQICGSQGLAQLAQKAVNKQAARSVSVTAEGDAVSVALHIEAEYGPSLRDVARAVQRAVAEAIENQIGARVAKVDVFVDAIQFSG